MTDDKIRQIIRSAIGRHLGPGAVPPASADPSPPSSAMPIAFARYTLPRAPDDVMCIIEPDVKCNHCGFCQCHGH